MQPLPSVPGVQVGGGRVMGPAGGPRLSLSMYCFPDQEAGPGGAPKAEGVSPDSFAECGSVHVPIDMSDVFFHRCFGRRM